MTDCPSCGRYVGPYDACPYCGAALSGRTSVRVLKVAALILTLGGLALLWLLATQTDVPRVEIGQANAMMNMSYVRVEGRVTRLPSYDPETDYFSFWVTDDSGELHVAAYRNETRELLSQGRTPALGDRVTVQGTLRVREDFVSLTLNLPEHLEIHRAEPLTRSIGDVSATDEFTRVRVRGQVRHVRAPYPGLTLIGLRDETGAIELAVSEVITALSGDLPALAVEQAVEVVAVVSLYKETPQLSLARASDLILLDESLVIAPERTIDAIRRGQVGAWATVSGQVTRVAPFSAGVKYTLDDGSGQITLLLWQSVYDQLVDPDALGTGAVLRVRGQVAEYREELEIVPELPADVSLVIPAPRATPTAAVAPPTPRPTPVSTGTPTPAAAIPIGELDAGRSGEKVMLAGQVVEAASFSQGFKFTLDDDSGQIVLLTWLDTYDGIAGREGLRAGASVEVTGTLDEFEGQLQIVPSASAGVVVLTAGAGPPAPERESGSLGANDVGNWVSVTGQVTRVETFSSGVRVFLDDGSGEVMLLLWQNVFERVPASVELAVGSRLRVLGRVEEYQGTLEIVPALPFDLQAAPPPPSP